MAKVNKVTTNGTTYELQDYELNTKLSGFSGVVKNAAGTLSQAVAGTDYDYPVLKGTSAPSTSTKGSVGQRYVNTSARTSNGLAVEYVCVAAGSTYTWVSAGSTGASLSVIADTYSASSTYAIGDVVIYNGGLYKCTTTISSAEAWTSSHWTATTVDALISNLQTTIATKVNKTTTVNGKALSSNITLSSTDIKMADNTTIEASMTSLKTSVSEGKALIAAAVTDKGVETAASSSFSTIATNISNISSSLPLGTGSMVLTREAKEYYEYIAQGNSLTKTLNFSYYKPSYGNPELKWIMLKLCLENYNGAGTPVIIILNNGKITTYDYMACGVNGYWTSDSINGDYPVHIRYECSISDDWIVTIKITNVMNIGWDNTTTYSLRWYYQDYELAVFSYNPNDEII